MNRRLRKITCFIILSISAVAAGSWVWVGPDATLPQADVTTASVGLKSLPDSIVTAVPSIIRAAAAPTHVRLYLGTCGGAGAAHQKLALRTDGKIESGSGGGGRCLGCGDASCTHLELVRCSSHDAVVRFALDPKTHRIEATRGGGGTASATTTPTTTARRPQCLDICDSLACMHGSRRPIALYDCGNRHNQRWDVDAVGHTIRWRHHRWEHCMELVEPPRKELYLARCASRTAGIHLALSAAGWIESAEGCIGCADAGCRALDVVSCADATRRIAFTINAKTHQLVSTPSKGRAAKCVEICGSRACLKKKRHAITLAPCAVVTNQLWSIDAKGATIRWRHHRWEDCIAFGDDPRAKSASMDLPKVATAAAAAAAVAVKKAPAKAALLKEAAALRKTEELRKGREARNKAATLRKEVVRLTRNTAQPAASAMPQRIQPPRREDTRCRVLEDGQVATRKRRAVVTVIMRAEECVGKDDGASGSDSSRETRFGEGAQVLGFTLNTYMQGDDYDRVAMLWGGAFPLDAPQTQSCIASLQRAGWRPCIVSDKDDNWWRRRRAWQKKDEAFMSLAMKMTAFTMDYERIAILDTSVAIFSSEFASVLDVRLNVSVPIAAVRAFGCGADRGRCAHPSAGVLVLLPDMLVFETTRHALAKLPKQRSGSSVSSTEGKQLQLLFEKHWQELPWEQGASLAILEPKSALRSEWLRAADRVRHHGTRIAAVHFTSCKPFCGATVHLAQGEGFATEEECAAAKRAPCASEAGGLRPALEKWWHLRHEARMEGFLYDP